MRYSVQLNALFSLVLLFIDMLYDAQLGPLFLKLYGNICIADLEERDRRYQYIWSNSSPSLEPNQYRSRFLSNAVRMVDAKYLVPRLYHNLRANQDVVRSRFRSFLSGQNHPGRAQLYSKMGRAPP